MSSSPPTGPVTVISRTSAGLWTRERVLAMAGMTPEAIAADFRAAREETMAALRAEKHERRTIRTFRDGSMEETVEQGGAPDHTIRLRAAELVYRTTGVLRDEESAPDGPRQVNIQIVTHVPEPGAPEADGGVRVRVGEGRP